MIVIFMAFSLLDGSTVGGMIGGRKKSVADEEDNHRSTVDHWAHHFWRLSLVRVTDADSRREVSGRFGCEHGPRDVPRRPAD